MQRTFRWALARRRCKLAASPALVRRAGHARSPAARPPRWPSPGQLPADPHRPRGRYALGSGAASTSGDPFLWPDIYRLNTGVVEDPHWIYPGEVLRLVRCRQRSPRFPPTDTPAPPAADSAVRGRRAGGRPRRRTEADPTPTTSCSSPDRSSRPWPRPEQSSRSSAAAASACVAEMLKAYTDQPYRPLRRSEFYSSGFLTENQRLPYGQVLGPVTPPQIRATHATANALPYTAGRRRGAQGRHLSGGRHACSSVADRAASSSRYGDVVSPTGMAQVDRHGDGHYLASVVAVYGPIRGGQRVLPAGERSARRRRCPRRAGQPTACAAR